MNSTDTLIVLVSLLITGTWLLHRLDGLQWLPEIDDKKRILIPSLLFLSSPFLAEWLFSSVNIQKVEELTKPLIPLLTFILGQRIARREKSKEIREKQVALVTMLIFNTEISVIEAMAFVERKMMNSLKQKDLDEVVDFKAIYENYRLEIRKIYEQSNAQLDIIKFEAGRNCLYYMKQTEEFLGKISLSSADVEETLDNLIQARVYKAAGYENIIFLTKGFIPNSSSLHNQFIDGCIRKLSWEKDRFKRLKASREKKVNFWMNQNLADRQDDPEIELYFQHEMDAESYPIELIDKILSANSSQN